MKYHQVTKKNGRQCISISLRLLFWGLFPLLLVKNSLSMTKETDPGDHQVQLPIYGLHNHPRSADISPDERLVATMCTLENNAAGRNMQFIETVQLWDFKENRVLAEAALKKTNGERWKDGKFYNPFTSNGIVRFASNGDSLLALMENTIHILRASDLTQIKNISMAVPSTSLTTFLNTVYEHKPEIRAMEVAPEKNWVAIFWVRDYSYGRIDLYDIASGKLFKSWELPENLDISHSKGIAWSPDGKMLALSIPDELKRPDIFIFDVEARVLKKTLISGLYAKNVAFISDTRVVAVDSRDRGLIKNRKPKLRVLDLVSGKCIKEVSGRGSGVRYIVSASADGKRFLSFTGKMKAEFDWEYLAHSGIPVDLTFSVWNSDNYERIATSQHIPGLLRSEIRLSSRGTYAVSCGDSGFIYLLPK
jgi:WD40 repeat protein